MKKKGKHELHALSMFKSTIIIKRFKFVRIYVCPPDELKRNEKMKTYEDEVEKEEN